VRTTAEGVETLEQYDWLQAEGCTEIQGSFFSPPVAADTLLQLLVEKDATNETRKGSSSFRFFLLVCLFPAF